MINIAKRTILIYFYRVTATMCVTCWRNFLFQKSKIYYDFQFLKKKSIEKKLTTIVGYQLNARFYKKITKLKIYLFLIMFNHIIFFYIAGYESVKVDQFKIYELHI